MDYGPSLIPPQVAFPGATPQERELVGMVVDGITRWENGMGKDFRKRCEKFYHQYRGFKQFTERWERAGPRDRDGLIYDEAKHWGAHLHIPLSYRAIESVIPRMVENQPRLLVLPRQEQDRNNVEAMRLLIDKQQNQISIDLKLQAVARAGLQYGLGVGKTFWDRRYCTKRTLIERVLRREGESSHVLGQPEQSLDFDDPRFEDIDVFDFFWDPYGFDMESCKWTAHRLWFSLEDIMQRVQSKQWNTASAEALTEDQVRNLGGGGNHYDEIWQTRLLASGFSNYNFSVRGEQPHEVIEYHNGKEVITVLDRQVCVQAAENPVGEMPFQVFRPVPLGKQMVGIGVLEPIEHLQREFDTTRSQQVDLITVALARGFAYEEGAVDPDEVTFGPANLIAVNNARPADALFPIPTPDIPAGAFQHEAQMRNDIDLVTGLTDALDNQAPGNGNETATGAMLSSAGSSARVNLLSRRLEHEVVKPCARQFVRLNQVMITSQRQAVRIPEPNVTWDEALETSQWRWFAVGPGELAGEFDIEPEGGSMAAKNVQQERADAQMIHEMMAGDFYFDPLKSRLLMGEKLGLKHPHAYLRAPQPAVPMAALRMLIAMGYDPVNIAAAVVRAKQIEEPDEGGQPQSQIAQFAGSGTEGS